MKLTLLLAKDILPQVQVKKTSSVINNSERKMRWNAVGEKFVKARKGFTLFILNKGIDNIIRISELREKSGVLSDGVTETVKPEIKKWKTPIFRSFVSTYGCFIDRTSGFFIGKWYLLKRRHKGMRRCHVSRNRINNIDDVDKKFFFSPSIGFHHLLKKVRMCFLILLELNIFFKMY